MSCGSVHQRSVVDGALRRLLRLIASWVLSAISVTLVHANDGRLAHASYHQSAVADSEFSLPAIPIYR